MRVFPVEHNVVLVRAANLADMFDKKSRAQYLDVQDYALEFYSQANKGGMPGLITIEE
jgi:hypothetical protein